MKFNAITDIDVDFLKERAFTEAALIYAKPSTRKDRSLQQIRETCLYGHAAEVYLIQHCGFKDDTRDYRDVFDPNGKDVEVKVTSCENYVGDVLRRCNETAELKYRQYPKKLYVFIGDKQTLDYHLYSTYSYNGIEFIKD